MIHQIAERITKKIRNKNIIEDQETEIIQYGTEVLLSSMLGIAIILLVSLITGYIWHGVIFLILFILIRMYSGGYHADSYVRCNVSFVLTYIMSILLWRLCLVYHMEWKIWLLTIVGFVLTGHYAPVENHNKCIEESSKIIYKKISILIYAGLMALLLLVDIIGLRYGEYIRLMGKFTNQIDVSLYIKVILSIIVILMIVGDWKEKGIVRRQKGER